MPYHAQDRLSDLSSIHFERDRKVVFNNETILNKYAEQQVHCNYI